MLECPWLEGPNASIEEYLGPNWGAFIPVGLASDFNNSDHGILLDCLAGLNLGGHVFLGIVVLSGQQIPKDA